MATTRDIYRVKVYTVTGVVIKCYLSTDMPVFVLSEISRDGRDSKAWTAKAWILEGWCRDRVLGDGAAIPSPPAVWYGSSPAGVQGNARDEINFVFEAHRMHVVTAVFVEACLHPSIGQHSSQLKGLAV